MPADSVESIPFLVKSIAAGDNSIVARDMRGDYRFNDDLANASELAARLGALAGSARDASESAREALIELYEEVFDHQAFTGRSGTMFGFEGLGCVYWHMVSKLLLAVQEGFFATPNDLAKAGTRRRYAELYYRVRDGLGFNKTPASYGAFPADPYSHTPKHAGAQQPGMTGQVKEEILTRFGELGIRVHDGAVHFDFGLLRGREMLSSPRALRFLDVEGRWQELDVPTQGLAFTWCQVPFLYRLDDSVDPIVDVSLDDGTVETSTDLRMPKSLSAEVFKRTGRVQRVELVLNADQLFSG